jgi:hypothetical protein
MIELKPMDACCPEKKECCNSPACGPEAVTNSLKPDFPMVCDDATVCCGEPSGAPGAPHEKPGYRLWDFVEDFVDTPAGPVALVKTDLCRSDRIGTVGARLGIGRDRYRIAPGLYGVGQPDDGSPVLVTANYKLSFDILRSHLKGIRAWILVVETHGINVWCAAGKGSFSAEQVAMRVNATGLESIVSHRQLILPQLAATGVAARQVKAWCGFAVQWGPIHARHIRDYLDQGMRATPAMRQVTFTLRERTELIPVELNHLGKPTLYLLPALLLLSGMGPGVFSLNTAISRGWPALLAYFLAALTGTVVAPILLPWLPGSAFAIKGAGIGAAAGALLSAGFADRLNYIEMVALTLFIMAVSSYLTMNFTGSTPFTSPTGVEKEMRRAIPAQAVGALAALILWVGAGFMKG